MPGLAGVIRANAPLPEPTRVINALISVGRISGVRYRYMSFRSDRAVVVNTRTEVLRTGVHQPARDSTGEALLFLEGEIFNQKELRRNAAVPPATTLCGLLLALYSARGPEFVRLINGEFNILIYQKRQQRLQLFCDHLASYPMYILERPDGLYFGSEKKFILAIQEESPAIDSVGLLQIVAHRHNLDERTFLKGIRRLGPGTHLCYESGRLRVRREESLSCFPCSTHRRIKALREEWEERLVQATKARIQGKSGIFISLSGGLDSRAVACAIPRDFRPIGARTRGLDRSLEFEVAAQIARRLNFDHIQEHPFKVSNSTLLPRAVWRTECETPFMNVMSITHHLELKDRCKFLAGGWLGDISSGGHISVSMLPSVSRQKFVDYLYARLMAPTRATLKYIFCQQFLDRALPRLRDAFVASFSAREEASNIRSYEMWDLYQRQTRQTTSSMPVDSYLFEKIRPFYDKEYLNFTLCLPLRLRFGQSLYQSMIFEIGPEIRDIPNANSMLSLRSSPAGNLTNTVVARLNRQLPRRIRKLVPSYRSSLEKLPVEDFAAGIRQDARFRAIILRFLRSDSCESAIWNRTGIETAVHEHYSGMRDHSYLLGHVATFAVGLPYFLRKAVVCPQEAEPLQVTDVHSAGGVVEGGSVDPRPVRV